MATPTIDRIRPLIVAANEDGSLLRVTFCCPVSGQTFSSAAPIESPEPRSPAVAPGGMLGELRGALAGALRSVGGGDGGADGEEAEAGAGREAALLRAFAQVAHDFVWDEPAQRYLSAGAAGAGPPEFVEQLHRAPVTRDWDRKVLARMLAEVARADGAIAASEQRFVAGFITPQMGTLDEIASLPPLEPSELARTAPGPSRETLVMLAWAVALTDERLDPAEKQRIAQYGDWLDLLPERATALRRIAALYLIDQALDRVYAGGTRDAQGYAQVQQLTDRLGLDAAALESVEQRFCRRRGLA
jgi:uncharacterized tellurite resistance protein B-like protein